MKEEEKSPVDSCYQADDIDQGAATVAGGNFLFPFYKTRHKMTRVPFHFARKNIKRMQLGEIKLKKII